jgi:hypothetical protein
MRWVVLVLALAGAGGSGFIGFRWFSDAEAFRTTIHLVRAEAKTNPKALAKIQEVQSAYKASFFLMAGLPLGIIGALLAISRRGILAALVLIVAFAGPPILIKDQLLEKTDLMIGLGIWTGALLLAGLLAFFIRPKRVIPEEERAYAGV